jgi:hypothetical protein
MYIVPDNWTLLDCVCIGYSYSTQFMMRDDEFTAFMKYNDENGTRLYDEIVKQPCIYNYTSDDGGDPDFEKIMDVIPVTGRLFDHGFPEEAYTLVKGLEDFAKEHQGKRYMCLN